MAVDKFSELEDRIHRTIELVKQTRMEKDQAERQLAEARREVQKLEADLESLRQERDLVRSKVEMLLGSLNELTEASLV